MEKDNIEKQLAEVRMEQSNKFNPENFISKNDVSTKDINHSIHKSKNVWRKNTTLIVDDSLISGLIENRMGANVKVRSFPGTKIKDFYNYLVPLLENRPSNLILMAGCSDATIFTSETILNELLLLKKWILQSSPGVNVCLSCPTERLDDSKARITIHHLRKNSEFILNNNINVIHLGQKGLHLNGKGSGRLAMNYLSHIRRKH